MLKSVSIRCEHAKIMRQGISHLGTCVVALCTWIRANLSIIAAPICPSNAPGGVERVAKITSLSDGRGDEVLINFPSPVVHSNKGMSELANQSDIGRYAGLIGNSRTVNRYDAPHLRPEPPVLANLVGIKEG